MRALIGAGILAIAIFLIMTLRPRDGKEKPIVRLPGMWIPLGLGLAMSIGTGVALIITSGIGW